jgi:glycosyltransferase involved in cell wall biosynthesis
LSTAEQARAEPRIRLVRRSANGGIARATNDALALARGEYCAFLDHDDRLAPDALLCMAEAMAESPDAALLFSDEDKLDANGMRTRPYFKPAWDGEWIRTTNCVLHFMVARTSTLRALGGLATGIDGAQDWDLVLRVAEMEGRQRIRHEPQRPVGALDCCGTDV